MKFKAYHGVYDFEKRGGNNFVVDFKGYMDMSAPAKSDDVADAVNYGRVFEIVKVEMMTPSNLLENVAGRIVDALAAEFPQLESFEVKVSKQDPPVDGKAEWSAVTLFFER